MTRLAIVIVAGCASAPKPAVPLEVPAVACKPAEPPPAASPPETPAPPDRAVRRDDVRRELASVEAEVDALDDEIAAAAVATGPSRDDTLAAVTARMAIVRPAELDNLHPELPRQLRLLGRRYVELRVDKAMRERDLGPRHPEIVELGRKLDRVRAAFDRQRNVEVAELQALLDIVAKLAKTASVPHVRQARLRALLDVVVRFAPEALAPSDAPADVRIAVDRVADVARELDELSPVLGPKHPDMIRLVAERDDAAAALKSAIAAADHAITHDILQLDAPHPSAAIDPAKLAKRVELAARARELRRELDALSP